MIRLDSTTRKLQALLAGAITTNQLPIVVCYSDKTATTYNGGTSVINTNSGTAVDICAAPAASTVRDIDTIDIQNADTAAATLTVRYNDNGTTYTLFKAVLAVGDQVTYVHGMGWKVLDSTGATKVLSGEIATLTGAQTLTNKTFALGNNTLSGTFAQFNTACTDADFARTDAANTFTGVQTMTSPAITTPAFTGAFSGTYSLGGTPTINVAAAVGGTWTAAATWTLPAHTLGGNVSSTGNPSLNIGTGALTAGAATFGTITLDSNLKQLNARYVQGFNGTTPGVGAYIDLSTDGSLTLVPQLVSKNTIIKATNGAGTASTIGTFSSTGLAVTGTLSATGDLSLDKTITAAGTTGAQTINKSTGSVNFAAAATSLVVTNSLVTASSIINCTVGTNDATMKSVNAVAAAGSFTIYANAAATAETRVNFRVTN